MPAQAALMWAVSTGVVESTIAIYALSILASAVDAYILGQLLAPDSATDLGKQNFTIRSAAEPHKIVYGRQMVGGTLVFLDVLDKYYLKTESGIAGTPTTIYEAVSPNKYLNMAMAIAAHEIDAVEQVWIGDDLVYEADIATGELVLVDQKYKGKIEVLIAKGSKGQQYSSFIKANVDKHYDGAAATDATNLEYYRPYGATSVSGGKITLSSSKVSSSNNTLKYLIDSTVLNDSTATQWANSSTTYDGVYWLNSSEIESNPHTRPVEGLTWTSSFKLTNTAYIYVRFNHDPDLYKNGLPKVRTVIRGKKVYDPRLSGTLATAAWAPGTSYTSDIYYPDLSSKVLVNGVTYRCVRGHTSSNSGDFNTDYFTDFIRDNKWQVVQSSTIPESWQWSDNWALCIRDYLTSGSYYSRLLIGSDSSNSLYGIGVTDNQVDDNNIIEAANIADETVVLNDPGVSIVGSGSWDEELGVQTVFIQGKHTDYYAKYEYLHVTSSHPQFSANPYNNIIYMGTPSGVYQALKPANTVPNPSAIQLGFSSDNVRILESVYNATTNQTVIKFKTERDLTPVTSISIYSKRFTVTGVIDTSQSPLTVLEDLLAAGAGSLPFSQGKFLVIPGVYNMPIAPTILDESFIAGDISVSSSLGVSDRVNTIAGTIKNPSANWEETDFPKQTHTTYINEDGGYELKKTVKYPFTTSNFSAQRLARISLLRHRLQVSATLVCNAKALPIPIGSFIKVNIAELGWNNKEFSVVSWRFDNGNIILGIREEASNAYTWDNTTLKVRAYPTKTSLRILPDLSPVSNLKLSSGSVSLLKRQDGTIVPRVLVSWNTGTRSSGTKLKLDIQINRSTKKVVYIKNYDINEYYISDVSEGDKVTVRATVVIDDPNILDEYIGITVIQENHVVVGKSAAPNPISGLTATTNLEGRVALAWTNPVDIDLDHLTIYRSSTDWASATEIGTTNGRSYTDTISTGTYKYWVVAVDTTDHASTRFPNDTIGITGTSTAISAGTATSVPWSGVQDDGSKPQDNATATGTGNMVLNGSAELGDNTGFPSMTYDSTDGASGSGCFSRILSGDENLTIGPYIPISDIKEYLVSIAIKVSNANQIGYFGIDVYNEQKQRILIEGAWRNSNTNTLLAANVNPGDTSILIYTPTTAWSTVYHSVVHWNVKNDHSDLPQMNTTRILSMVDNGDGTTTVNLGNGQNGANIAYSYSGPPLLKDVHMVGNAYSGSTFAYGLLSNQVIGTTSWVNYKQVFSPDADLNDVPRERQIRVGARYLRLFWRPNTNAIASTPTCKLDDYRVSEYIFTDWSDVTNNNNTKPQDNADVTASSSFVNITYPADKTGLQTQIDGKAELWFQATDPSNSWSIPNSNHNGDWWYKTDTKKIYSYNGTIWNLVEDQKAIDAFNTAATAQSTADGKLDIYTVQPVTPYKIGDLWDAGGTPRILKRCITSRASGPFVSGDWVSVANEVTDTNQLTDGALLGQTAKWQNVLYAPESQDNLLNRGTFEDGSIGLWSSVTYGGVPGNATVITVAASITDFSKAARFNTRDAYENSWFPVSAGEKIHVSGFLNTGGSLFSCGIGLNTMTRDSVNSWPTVPSTPAGAGWVFVSGWVTIPAGAIKARGFVQQNGLDFTTLSYVEVAKFRIARTEPGSDVTNYADNRVANSAIQVGARNLLPLARQRAGVGVIQSSAATGYFNGSRYSSEVSLAQNQQWRMSQFTEHPAGEYSLTFWMKASVAVTVAVDICDSSPLGQINLTTTWQKFTFEGVNVTSGWLADPTYYGFLDFKNISASTATVYIDGLMLQLGNKATSWTPAPEDVDSATDSAALTASWPQVAGAPGSNFADALNNSHGVKDNADVTNYADTRVANAIIQNSILTVAAPIGGAFSSNAIPATGAIKITLPQSWTDTMMRMDIDVYLYNSSTADATSFRLSCGGYNWNGALTKKWANSFAHIIGNTSADNRVRFGHDGSKCCIVIGNTGSKWWYPKIAVKNFQGGFSNYAVNQWETGWNVSIVSSLNGITFDLDFPDALLDAASIKGQGALATKGSVDMATNDVINKSLANVDPTANTKLVGIQDNAQNNATVVPKTYNQQPMSSVEEYLVHTLDSGANPAWYKIASCRITSPWRTFTFAGTLSYGYSSGRYYTQARIQMTAQVSNPITNLGLTKVLISTDDTTVLDDVFRLYHSFDGTAYTFTIYSHLPRAYDGVRLKGEWVVDATANSWMDTSIGSGSSLGITYTPPGTHVANTYNYTPGATVGAQAGLNLTDSGGAPLTDTLIKNSNTTPADIGYTGHLAATRNFLKDSYLASLSAGFNTIDSDVLVSSLVVTSSTPFTLRVTMQFSPCIWTVGPGVARENVNDLTSIRIVGGVSMGVPLYYDSGKITNVPLSSKNGYDVYTTIAFDVVITTPGTYNFYLTLWNDVSLVYGPQSFRGALFKDIYMSALGDLS